MSVALIDYGSGNLHSAAKAIELAARSAGERENRSNEGATVSSREESFAMGAATFTEQESFQ